MATRTRKEGGKGARARSMASTRSRGPGQGSEFIVRLPLPSLHSAEALPQAPAREARPGQAAAVWMTSFKP